MSESQIERIESIQLKDVKTVKELISILIEHKRALDEEEDYQKCARASGE